MAKTQAQINAENTAKSDLALAISVAAANTAIASAFSQGITSSMDSWLEEQYERLQQAVNDTRSALFLADCMYDQVMQATVPDDIFEIAFRSLLAGLTLVNPEFSVLSGVIELGMPGEKEKREERLKRTGALRDLVQDVVEKEAEGLTDDQKAKSHETTLNAKTQIIQDKIEECSENADWITTMYFAFKKRIGQMATGSTPGGDYAMLQQAWYAIAGPRVRHYRHGTDTQLALVILYNMMRKYCKSVKLKLGRTGFASASISTVRVRQMLGSGDQPDDVSVPLDFQGLDEGQRDKMFKLFDQLAPCTWRTLPKVTNWVQLVKNWDFAS